MISAALPLSSYFASECSPASHQPRIQQACDLRPATMPSALTSKTMWRAILITIVMHTLGRIVSHICWQHVDSTIINAVPDDLPQPQAKESDFRTRHSFYLKELPIEVLCGLPIAMLAYRWHYLLEKMWPSRPRHSHISTQQAEKKVESDDELEEEIMRKLIAKGKVRRSSISWCNTLLKWSISNVLGTLLFNAASVMLIGAFKLQTPATTWPDLKDVNALNQLMHLPLNTVLTSGPRTSHRYSQGTLSAALLSFPF